MMTTIQYWQRNRHVDQWNKVENPRDFTNRQKIKLKKKQRLQQTVVRKLYIHMQKNEIRLVSTIMQKSKPKCAKDLNVKPKTLKLIGENIDSTLQYLDVRNFTRYRYRKRLSKKHLITFLFRFFFFFF